MKIAIFGGTGKTGTHLVQQALAANHIVSALARNPSKFAVTDEHLRVIQGSVQDANAVAQTLRDVEAVLSVLGPTSNQPTFEVSQGMTNIIAAMKQQQIRRLIVSVGAGVADPQDEPQFINRFFSFILPIFSKYIFEDMKRTDALVRASALDWTIVRVPRLVDGNRIGNVRIGYVGKGVGISVTRADLAETLLKQLDQTEYLHQAPAVSN